MPRRRQRKTDRVRQEDRTLRLRAVRRGKPDAKKLSRAFISLALARAEQEAEAEAQQRKPADRDVGTEDADDPS